VSAPEFSIESFPAALSKPENAPLLAGVLRGIEKESLRVDAEGQFNLAQLMAQLRSIHQFTASALGDEMLWASSMPCAVNEAQIPVAQYGSGYRGQMKTVYRVAHFGLTGSNVAKLVVSYKTLSMPNTLALFAIFAAITGCYCICLAHLRHCVAVLWKAEAMT